MKGETNTNMNEELEFSKKMPVKVGASFSNVSNTLMQENEKQLFFESIVDKHDGYFSTSYATMRSKDKRKVYQELKKGKEVEASYHNHYVKIGGTVYNGFSIEEIKKMCDEMGVKINLKKC